MSKPRICLLLGDPCGIGPEIAAKLLAKPDVTGRADVLVLGDRKVFAAGRQAAGVTLEYEEVQHGGHSRRAGGIALFHVPFAGRDAFRPGEVWSGAGAHVLELLRLSADSAASREVDAVVYAPLNKQAMMEGGLDREDEMMFLADYLDCKQYVCELNTIDGLWTSRVTSHIPLSEVAARITVEAIGDAVAILHRTLGASGISSPRIAVSALNPHAGEGGRFGREEVDVIAPAVEAARAQGIDAVGPLPADTIFVRARREGFHGVVSMFHDQCQIAMKLMGFDRGVTVLAGLPFPVTTPAHGTAFDIVGQGIANPEPIGRAFNVALRLAGARS
ncbi:MAG: 4-hydroxythreonine-4-phosphate dehydrogenase PdxA [Alphaproteobacteria bacterium]